MARFSRWGLPLVAGIGIWLGSFPLLAGHPAGHPTVPSAPVSQSFWALGVDQGVRPHHSPARPPLIIGERLVAPPAVAAVARSGPATLAPLRPNWIYVPRLGVSQPVGWYSDCLGRAPVPRWGTWRWSCAGPNNTYIMAHNPGVFSPILALHAGDLLEYDDPAGRLHTYRIGFTTVVSNQELWPLDATPVASLTLQTCWTWDGTRDFIVRAIEI